MKETGKSKPSATNEIFLLNDTHVETCHDTENRTTTMMLTVLGVIFLSSSLILSLSEMSSQAIVNRPLLLGTEIV